MDQPKKAITPVISIIILLLITVALAGAGWSFIFGYWEGITSKQIEVIDSFCVASGEGKVLIKNIGTSDLITNEIAVMDKKTGTDLSDEITWSGDIAESGLVLELKFDEGTRTNIIDTSGNNNNGIYIGETYNDGTLGDGSCTFGSGSCPSLVSGKFGKALNFDGDDDITFWNTGPELSEIAGNELTIEAWIKPKDLTGVNYIISKNGPFFLYLNNNNVNGVVLNSSVVWAPLVGTIPLSLNEWQHVAMVYDGNEIVLYVNGQFDNSKPHTGDLFGNGCVQVGRQNTGGCDNGVAFYFNGTIDEIRIYNRSLTQQEIQSDMNSGFPIERPVASWQFENFAGTTVLDSHIWVKGKTRNALSFDGVNDYVSVPDDASLNISGSEISMEMWLNSSNATAGYTFLIRKQTPGYNLVITPTGNIRVDIFHLFDVTWKYSGCTSNSALSSNKWYHVVGTFEENQSIKIFINGNLDKECAPPTYNYPIGLSSSTLVVGYQGWWSSDNAYFNGTIDEVRVYNRILEEAEIKALATKTVPISPGKTATFTHDCNIGKRCDYRLIMGGSSKSAIVQC